MHPLNDVNIFNSYDNICLGPVQGGNKKHHQTIRQTKHNNIDICKQIIDKLLF